MESVYKCDKSGHEVMLIRGLGVERDRAEEELLDVGVRLPLSHRAIWTANPYQWEPWFLLVRDASGRACAGTGMERIRSRTMPGYSILRMRRFGGNLSNETRRIILETAARLAMESSHILRLDVNVFAREGRNTIAETLQELGFTEIVPPSTYRYTLAIDLRPNEDEIFASLGSTARAKIRKSARKALRIVRITDLVFAARIRDLQQQALQHSGGQITSENWPQVINMCARYPDLSCIFGLIVGEEVVPENMHAFGWVCNHGDHGEYRAAGASRDIELKVPLGYLPAWEMIRWAKNTGSVWFDMGGITLSDGDETELKGVSDFKRHFSQNVVEVGAEWVLEPSPVHARIADILSSGIRFMRTQRGRLQRILQQ
jgi:hypothetical protein